MQSFGTNPSSFAFNHNPVYSQRAQPLDAPALILNNSRASNSICVSEDKDLVLPYSGEEIVSLDVSLVDWLK